LFASAGELVASGTANRGVIVDAVTVSVNRVGANALTTIPLTIPAATVTQEDLSATSGGHVVLDVTSGALELKAGTSGSNAITAGSGNTRLNAQSGALMLNAMLDGGSGNITILSTGSQSYGVDGDVVTTGGTIDVQATSAGSIIGMNSGTLLQTNGGNIRVMAGTIDGAGATVNAGGNVTLGVLDARVSADRSPSAKLMAQTTSWGSVSVTSTGGTIEDKSNDITVNIYAKALRLSAATVIGFSNEHLETEVAMLSRRRSWWHIYNGINCCNGGYGFGSEGEPSCINRCCR